MQGKPAKMVTVTLLPGQSKPCSLRGAHRTFSIYHFSFFIDHLLSSFETYGLKMENKN